MVCESGAVLCLRGKKHGRVRQLHPGLPLTNLQDGSMTRPNGSLSGSQGSTGFLSKRTTSSATANRRTSILFGKEKHTRGFLRRSKQMPRTMNFEAKYKAHDVKPFDQKNEMFKRVRWQPEFMQLARSYYGVTTPEDKPGYRLEDIAFRNAAWYLEMGFARGVIESNFGLYSWEDELYQMTALPMDPPFDSETPQYNSRMVKKAARLFGADMVGICQLDRRWIYSKGFELVKRVEYEVHIPDEYQYVINMAVAMDYEYYKYTPTFIGGAGTGMGYSKMAFTAGLLGQFLNQLGYKSIPTGNDTALSIPLAIRAGLGELGRSGLLITPRFGSGCGCARSLPTCLWCPMNPSNSVSQRSARPAPNAPTTARDKPSPTGPAPRSLSTHPTREEGPSSGT